MKTPANKTRRTRLIGYVAFAVCGLGYGGMGLALLMVQQGHLPRMEGAFLAAGIGLVGEIGLWVGAACFGLGLWHRRKAMFDRILRRSPQAVSEV